MIETKHFSEVKHSCDKRLCIRIRVDCGTTEIKYETERIVRKHISVQIAQKLDTKFWVPVLFAVFYVVASADLS